MIESIGIAISDVGTVIGLWGVAWHLWDDKNITAGICCWFGVVALLIGQFDRDIDLALKATAQAEREDALNRLRAIHDFRQQYPL